MKVLLAALLIVGALVFLVAYSFGSYFAGITYVLPAPQPEPEPVTAPGGGEPRNPAYRAGGSTSSSPSEFHGPSGPPQIVGPSAPPPGQ